MIVAVVLVYALVIFIQLVPVYKNNNRRDFWVNLTITIISFIIAILLSLNIKISSPSDSIKDIIIALLGK
ncbi:MAG TPA: hypothetical protein DEP72_00495 [Clostridiales bacterium]|nr:MAG: hypothetical protein A2Y18_03250 [Clostridiales bacterium GWD2_32_19]HCC06630.1 hypothetical protein [Clostridiales bacterium]